MQVGARHARSKGTCRWGHGARKQGKHTRTQRAMSTLVFSDVDLCCRMCLWNMHHAQSKARAGGLYVNHPGYCFVAQICSRCAAARSCCSVASPPCSPNLRSARPGSANCIRQCWHAREQEDTRWEKQGLRSSRRR